MSVPSVAYALQNNLDFIALSHLDAGLYQLNNAHDTNQEKKGNYLIGISAVLATCITAGFAGVYFEMMLKGSGTTPFWIRNLQMYSCGMVSALIGCLFSEGDLIIERGFFYGYDIKVCAIVGKSHFYSVHATITNY
ncbi:UDP-galactose transporter [Teladorsagia circumcincta]|uniref:UDP-galactose transporter n=1 Tax=Teladorsagia circumcincta TaxID=45464 RepID=A0A2G9UXE0_TELCI|nr:UDP-galactose transporter [Teladorsagia circumcincta]